ncbi:hypothetical protein P872_09080 [Rhodonellum psychrophilum GCM71 = DSM 17998]|uniref:Uncharacterized protein n=1 Tax=Rhodonellum psychrophilum GCM71 = DSM 17998 TaxID=1123057 RepID=U5BZA0_9BACT|nr:hypothetical protein P872_09080 [Rhodonellum psychrophilum GCM71 = DSM 17998]
MFLSFGIWVKSDELILLYYIYFQNYSIYTKYMEGITINIGYYLGFLSSSAFFWCLK